MLNIDNEIFIHNLKLTQEYCRVQMNKEYNNNAQIFRSYNPVVDGMKI